jgi:radical SAM superfamily enzyme YgiQ (UPF0313 family)
MPAPVVALVGAELEENLSLRYLAAALAAKGFEPRIVPFSGDADPDVAAREILATAPLAVGLSLPFQLRARETLEVASRLRAHGYGGGVVAGGHFATFEHRNILARYPAVDAVVRHEGEQTLVELCERLRDGVSLAGLAGTVARGPSGPVVGPKRPLAALDELLPPLRQPVPADVLGVRIAPVVGSRGCYADCAFCCIYAYAENADGPRYRMRSVESIAAEMEAEYRQRGARLFVFHDDNFFVPSVSKNRARYRRLAELLAAAGMNDIGLVIKCRPNDVDRGLFEDLRAMGMMRAYVGIETNSDEGIVSLNRRISTDDNARALSLFEELSVFATYNVLIFDPEATFDGIAKNLDFMERFAATPFNFCRAEVYAGTPLQQILASQGRLEGDFFAWTYRMRDPRVELLFRIATTAFAARNFRADGVANLGMGIRFDAEVLRRFYRAGFDEAWHRGLVAYSREVGEDSVRRLREMKAFAERVDLGDGDLVKAFTVEQARAIARSDLAFVGRAKVFRREIEARIRAAGGPAELRCAGAAPPWAAETGRLGESVGRGISTEVLPAPAAGNQERRWV